MSSELDKAFDKAFEKASAISYELPQDVRLRIYAYYKQATNTEFRFALQTPNDLRDAFKMNAWMQVRHLTIEEAKKSYIEIIDNLEL